MKLIKSIFTVAFGISTFFSCGQTTPEKMDETSFAFEISKTEEEWKKQLTEMEFEVLRKAGTEPAFSGEYVTWKKEGVFVCKACQNPLFSSETKFKSGTGWPSFYDVINKNSVVDKADNKYGWNRTEVICQRCGSHLGHIFEDGPDPTGLRYCINSVCLDFKEK